MLLLLLLLLLLSGALWVSIMHKVSHLAVGKTETLVYEYSFFSKGEGRRGGSKIYFNICVCVCVLRRVGQFFAKVRLSDG